MQRHVCKDNIYIYTFKCVYVYADIIGQNNTIGSISNFSLARRPTYLKINLNVILNNVLNLKRKLAKHTEIIAVVKANAYGHGAVAVSRFLEKNGYTHFAVSTALEGEELRAGGIKGSIQVLGNASEVEIPTMQQNNLIPTVADIQFLSEWLHYRQHRQNKGTHDENNPCSVVVNVDSGMSRDGCQPEQLECMMQFCADNAIPVHSLMTHFAQPWSDPVFTQKQLDIFTKAIQPYRQNGMKLQVANSDAIARNVGVDLDYVRAGVFMYGLAYTAEDGISTVQDLGLKPALSWIAKTNLVKDLPAGRVVGYDQLYTCRQNETLATVPIGHADGYLRNMFGRGYLTTFSGIKCPVVGRVSMDSITVTLPEGAKDCREFYVITDDYNDVNSVVAIARMTNTSSCEVCTNLHDRIHKLYTIDGVVTTNV